MSYTMDFVPASEIEEGDEVYDYAAPSGAVFRVVCDPKSLLYIYGMQLEGARWAEERSELDEALPKVRTQKSYCYKSGKLIAFLLKIFRH